MGNYLLSLRVPPPSPSEDERNHPSYYDWTTPKWTPFRTEKSTKCIEVSVKGSSECFTGKSLGDSTQEAIKSAGKKVSSTVKEIGKDLKDKLTSTVDTSSKKPPNFGTHKQSHIAKSTKLQKTTSKSLTIKKVDSTRPHTIDQRKYDNMKDQASIKAATNIHIVEDAVKAK